MQSLKVSISLSSGFSFQAIGSLWPRCTPLLVSISLSSGFSFQGIGLSARVTSLAVSISLSSGFSFQENKRMLAAHVGVSFNLVIERLLISG